MYIISAVRTPIGSFGGSLSTTPATQLGGIAIKNAVSRANIDQNLIEEVFFGNVCSANLGQAPARQAALAGGLNIKTICTTVNKVCASGMKSVMFGSQSIELKQNDLVVAGGMENMSMIPFYLSKARYGYGYGNAELIDGLAKDGLTDAYQPKAMGCFADATAAKYEISREQQDEFAINSYKRAANAWSNGQFKIEVIDVEIIDKKGNIKIVNEDEEFKNVNFDKIPNLKPVFTKEGTVTAANASTINDGASALVLASDFAINQYNLQPIARIVAYADSEHEPEWFTTSPVNAAQKALKRANLTLNDIDYFEVNEAFSAVALVFIKNLGLDIQKVNVSGGAVALGHPLGCSGARILTTLIHILKQNKAKYGLAAICNGGGGSSAMIIENL
jgi:acetyl-CoA C-acetyltransferase